jgi:hypothetical protein
MQVNSCGKHFSCHSHLLSERLNYPEEPPLFLFGITANCTFALRNLPVLLNRILTAAYALASALVMRLVRRITATTFPW